jgi:unsaturated rhamnogalacturonyl hydrolase
MAGCHRTTPFLTANVRSRSGGLLSAHWQRCGVRVKMRVRIVQLTGAAVGWRKLQQRFFGRHSNSTHSYVRSILGGVVSGPWLGFRPSAIPTGSNAVIMVTRSWAVALLCWSWLGWLTMESSVATGLAAEPTQTLSQWVAAELPAAELRIHRLGRIAPDRPLEAILWSRSAERNELPTRILLVGRSDREAAVVRSALTWFYTAPESARYRQNMIMGAVPDAGFNTEPTFPPPGIAYSEPPTEGAHYLWRGLGMIGPDLVVEVVQQGERQAWFVPPLAGSWQAKLQTELTPAATGRTEELASALIQSAPCQTGLIPALRVDLGPQTDPAFLPTLLAAVQRVEPREPSAARRELQRRGERSPRQVAEELSRFYGKELNEVMYIPAMALVGRLWLAEQTNDAQVLPDVERIVGRYRERPAEVIPNSGSGLSGHLIFAELAERTQGEKRQGYVQLARAAADQGLTSDGEPREIMPYHLEMSDALYMGGPILAHVGFLTGDPRYYQACIQHLRSMRKRVLRPDGIYRHSPLDETAWGRGNGFPALGLAWCLTYWPRQRPDHAELLTMFREHMTALLPLQDEEGCWHQVIDRSDSYRELSCTCMITWAMTRGVRLGWLDAKTYRPAIERGWSAIRRRIGTEGRLVDVCTGTGKQKSLEAYYHRPAILGADPRGGAMGLLVATELARLTSPGQTAP